MNGTGPGKVSIIGAGVVGTSLGCALAAGGHAVAVASRTEEGARRAAERIGNARACRSGAEAAAAGDWVFLTVPDRAIGPVCAEIAEQGGFRPGARVLHTSGALDSEVLAPARRAGCETGSLHPLQTFASVDAALGLFRGTYFFFEGCGTLGRAVERLVEELDGVFVTLAPGGKALYHAAAATACNYVVTLTREAVGLMEAAGVKREQALPALLPLLKGTVRNLETEGLPRALTGPIARGDTVTVARHLTAIRERAAGLEELYLTLGRRTAALATEKGTLAPEAARELEKLLGDGGAERGRKG